MTGRAWAYFGLLVGGAVSVAANVAHSYVPPADALAEWTPQPGAVAGAVFWPVALFIAIEILARVTWPRGGWWQVLRFGGMALVAVVAAVVSYRHLSGLLDFYGEDTLTVYVGPVAVDGLMAMATAALVATGKRHRVADVVAEQATGGTTAETPTDATPHTTADPSPKTTRKTTGKTTPTVERVAALVAEQPDMTQADVADKIGCSVRTVQRYWPSPNGSQPAAGVTA